MNIASRRPAGYLTTGIVICVGFITGQAIAQDNGPDADVRELSPVTILGNESRRDRIPGSAHYIGPERLEEFRYSDVMRVLRDVPGVYIQEEEGFGLRPNIGIRGSGLDRSARIALLEAQQMEIERELESLRAGVVPQLSDEEQRERIREVY